MIKWNITTKEMEIIEAIVDRAIKLDALCSISKSTLAMDITACHANGNPLNLIELLNANNGNFCHDIYGINRYINRETGKLQDCFLPRSSM